MEERKLTEKESLEVITSMIARTRQRYIGDGRIMLMWGYLVVAVAVLVWTMIAFTGQVIWNVLWFVIPIVGGIATPLMARREQHEKGARTYSDIVTARLWTFAGISEFVMMLVCFCVQLFTGAHCWTAMLAYTLIAMSFTEIAWGLFVKENSFIAGGLAGLAAGIVTVCCIAGDIPLYANWYMPVFILAFVAMNIVPGHILNHKAKENR